jgi:peptide/nickel transport system ATP-binding protein
MTHPATANARGSNQSGALIDVQNLRVTFATAAGTARAVDGVSFRIAPGEIVGMVGESGCGKTVSGLSILRLIEPPGRIDPTSHIHFEGQDLIKVSERDIRRVRGRRIAMVFQEPMTALNPVFTVGDQIAEVVRVHESTSRSDAWRRAVEMLERVGLSPAAERAKQYPHQLSGGMRQRVLIGMALVMRPALLIADEPTTALDVTVQAQILDLLRELQRDFGMAVLLITHDLGVIAETASRVLVMYGGEIVEEASIDRLFSDAQHPYTQGLLAAMPRVDDSRERLTTIPGTVPPPTAWPSGCRFRDRCAYAWGRCAAEHPELFVASAAHTSRCFLVQEPERRVLAAAPTAERRA